MLHISLTPCLVTLLPPGNEQVLFASVLFLHNLKITTQNLGIELSDDDNLMLKHLLHNGPMVLVYAQDTGEITVPAAPPVAGFKMTNKGGWELWPLTSLEPASSTAAGFGTPHPTTHPTPHPTPHRTHHPIGALPHSTTPPHTLAGHFTPSW